MPNLTNLQSQDFMAITRAMDANRNNRVDKAEANISWNAQSQIGNANGVAGTRELATSLEKGDVFITSLNPETADKIANYFSKRNENFDRPVADWVSDAWISKEDFQASPEVLRAVDSNGDNRISRKEFAEALVAGTLTIGTSKQTSHNPFTQPAPSNPFNSPSHDPFKPQPSAPHHDPFKPQPSSPFNDPYQNSERDSGAYLKLEMVRTLSSDYEKGQILNKLVGQTDMSTREQMMLVETISKGISSDYTQTELLKTLAKNPSLRDDAAIKLAKATREMSSDYNKGQVLGNLIQAQRLSPQAQQSVIISIGTISSEYTQVESFKSMVRSQRMDMPEKEFLMRQVGQNMSSDYNKRQVYDALMK
ncbi:hypothetical protein COW36_01915 [bacterium (Candidatus Blackallbacteria) CG17_big_fil_post_rev_8_21_14_2_50_48_46]|uniref:EF-hand domain-containing protein n=1 Tax=bacterium (Candidatus Blackallbacteria) CG17_big_fil_post_rev_8_21_14_2_50_48_46 TaxID=2014261 RepID=A0A2M7GAL0_9BACT|nr:MAG: hypothetical protein COW64_26305 [bacterium (Candidatus Blackallbacteria) CG18_big_fil_WC_8_21_14_2_50_49_26]PIW19192.1 MAG: hypothetical protein COW36_01915 [bacterium (Candidatus Blackallbacteria) CG17_big_fil_post_rev_8_21_14_2_50_48_46]PIW45458.1 MAG: hypothetical protein COW20_20225 [bacterium (Candidatus Blackallbacteria) CG13_big_fil_rev_8_21_14_2_50_49_14]